MNTRLQNNNKTSSGMTLVEMLVSVGVGMVVLAAIGMLMVFTTRSFIALGNYNDLDQASRNALDTMSREIRQTKTLLYYNPSFVWFTNQNATELYYGWDSASKKLYRWVKVGGAWQYPPKVMLEQCDYLRFGMSQQNPSNNFNFYSTTTPATAKLIDVSWTCSRQILQKKVNTESVQTAKIVMRN